MGTYFERCVMILAHQTGMNYLGRTGGTDRGEGRVFTVSYTHLVSMNPIMIDGTGMCGGCRLTVGGETKFACVDGPDFDGHLVDFDEAMKRGAMYREFETHAREEACRLYGRGE